VSRKPLGSVQSGFGFCEPHEHAQSHNEFVVVQRAFKQLHGAGIQHLGRFLGRQSRVAGHHHEHRAQRGRRRDSTADLDAVLALEHGTEDHDVRNLTQGDLDALGAASRLQDVVSRRRTGAGGGGDDIRLGVHNQNRGSGLHRFKHPPRF
jgi:hypothetical protein